MSLVFNAPPMRVEGVAGVGVGGHRLQPKMSPEASATMFPNKSEA